MSSAGQSLHENSIPCCDSGGSEIEVKLLLPWRDYGKIEYNATAAWPLDKNKYVLIVDYKDDNLILASH